MIVVSNREPYIQRHNKDQIVCVQAANGLWPAAMPISPPAEPSYILRRVWLTRQLEQEYYYGISNEGLWPCRMAVVASALRAYACRCPPDLECPTLCGSIAGPLFAVEKNDMG